MSLADAAAVAVPKTVKLPSGAAGDRWAVFLSHLQLLTAMTHERRQAGHWIGIHRDNLRKMLGRRSASRINDMVDAGAIDRNDSYWTGRDGRAAFTKAYRLSDMHRHGQSRIHQLTYLPAKRVAHKQREPDRENLREAGLHYWNHFRSFRMDGRAEQVAANHWTAWTIARWLSGDDFAKRCRYDRFHNLTTQTSRKARQFITTAGGEPLSIVDVSACQPLLLGLVAISRPQPHTAASRNQLLCNVARFSGGRGCCLAARKRAPTDIQRWMELCESSQLYQHFIDAIRNHNGPVYSWIERADGSRVRIDLRESTDKAIKRATLIPLFDDEKRSEASPIFKIIARDFPSIADFVRKTKAAEHEALARLLQRTEAALMIDGAGGVLIREFADEPVAPIHDALMVRKEFAGAAACIIADQFAKIGAKPNIDTKHIS